MCGIAGFFSTSQASWQGGDIHGIATAMGDRLYERGPDSSGVWTDATSGIALAHRRLAILDLSEHGHQPMVSTNGRYVMVYNGEVYNFPSLRAELEKLGHSFRGHSDTEVILAGCQEWGLEETLAKLNGMFAIALWDKAEHRLFLARDRVGIKPLFWSLQNGVLLFASQPKALLSHPTFKASLSTDALHAYMRFCYVPAPLSIYQGVYKLRPAHLLSVSAEGGVSETCYWDLPDVARRTPRGSVGSDVEATDSLDALLRDAVGSQMVADVPLGAFLSGGIDSSTVAAMMQVQSSRPVKTFTIGFHEECFDEAAHAAAVAKHLGTDHHELYVSPAQALDVVPKLPGIYDEPFADSSQIPTFLVSKLTREHVTVVLSGDGGDELFGGYNRYVLAERLASALGPIPGILRSGAANGVLAVSPDRWQSLLGRLPGFRGLGPVGDRLHKLAGILTFRDEEDIYAGLTEFWRQPSDILSPAHAVAGVHPDRHWHLGNGGSFLESMQLCDMMTYMVEDILAKVDRASMAVSLESRVPLLDHRLIEFCWGLNRGQKVRDGKGKWLLRQVLYRYVPPSLIERPKMGFGVPIATWLRGPLRGWAEELLSPSAVADAGLFDEAAIRRYWSEHQSGLRNWSYRIWPILMAQAWALPGKS